MTKLAAENWRDMADCQYVGDYLFFPVSEDVKADENAKVSSDYRAAKRICAGCAVREECLEDVMQMEYGLGATSRYGLRAGLAPRARAKLSRERGEPRRASVYFEFGHKDDEAA